MWLLFLFISLISGFCLPVSPVLAQDIATSSATPTPKLFLQYQKDYLYQYSLYQQSYLRYTDKKQVYTKYGTITTQKEKFLSAIEAINARNRTLKSYLLSLRVLLDDYKSANPTETEKVQIELSKWEAWFNEQLTIVPALNNQDDLNKWIDTFRQNYLDVQQVIYTALVRHEVNLRQSTLNQLQSVAQDIKNNPQIKPESQQWISSLTVKSDLVSTSLNDALALTLKPQNYQNHFNDFYPDARLSLGKSRDYLVEITTDLKLIVNKFFQK